MAQAFFLPASVLLCLVLGADALSCRVCSSIHPKMPCMPEKLSCNALLPKESCLAITISSGDEVQQKMLGCIQTNHKKCGMTWEDPKTNRKLEYKCCSNADYCNE